MYYGEMLVMFIYTAPQICWWEEPCCPRHWPCAIAAESLSHHPSEALLTGRKRKGVFAILCMELITYWVSQRNGNWTDVLGRVHRVSVKHWGQAAGDLANRKGHSTWPGHGPQGGNGCQEARLHLASPSSNPWSFIPIPFRPEALWHIPSKATQEET